MYTSRIYYCACNSNTPVACILWAFILMRQDVFTPYNRPRYSAQPRETSLHRCMITPASDQCLPWSSLLNKTGGQGYDAILETPPQTLTRHPNPRPHRGRSQRIIARLSKALRPEPSRESSCELCNNSQIRERCKLKMMGLFNRETILIITNYLKGASG